MARHGVGARVEVRIYLEGRLVDKGFISLLVGGHRGAPATAQLDMTPTNAIKHILYGTWVHVYTTDPWDLNPSGDLGDFKLLFEGVVVGKGWSKESNGRAFQIQCADPSIFWTEARQYWLNLTSAGGGLVEQVAIQTSMGAGRFGTLTSTGTYGYMVSKISQIQEDNQERFFDTLLAVIDDIGNVNPYYTNNRNRFRITDRILRAHCGKVEKLFQLSLLSEWLTELSNRVSGQSNIAQVVNELLEPIAHEWVSMPAPPYVDARIFLRDAFGNVVKKANKTVVPDGSGHTAQLFSYQMAREKIVATTMFKPDVYTLSPPTCNVLLPNMYERLGFNQNLLSEPTRLAMRPTLIGRDLSQVASLGMLFMRPNELEIFTQIVRDSKKSQPGEIKKRTPDAQFADGDGQAATFNDYDWGTNEERIRGIVYNFLNLAPAPATLTLSDQGKRQPDGTRKGGMPKYLQNVASYEWYKAKFAARTTGLSGPYNMRPVVGFPILAVDDSAAGLTIIAQLEGITHHIQASGEATTEYHVSTPRLVDEVDLNRPRFVGGSDPKTGEAILELARDADGNFQFEKLFEGKLRPPIPEWFSDDYRTLQGLDATYRSFFGDNVRVIEARLFNDPLRVAAATGGAKPVVAAAMTAAENEQITLSDAVVDIVSNYRKARDQGKEFEEASTLTARSMARIDEAFRFIGAAPIEFINKPANVRVIDYAKARFTRFVGDPTPGSGYSGAPEPANPSTTKNPQGTVQGASSQGRARVTASKTPQMSGAFPVFETKIHVGKDATDASQRAKTKSSEANTSLFPRYDGRPVMYDFEFRLWQESLKAAKVSSGSAEADAARQAAVRYQAGPNGSVVPISATAIAQNTSTKATAQQAKSAAQKTVKDSKSPTPEQQAPTGDSAENSPQLPLPQPLSERQIVDLRRAVVDAYVKELEDDRGFIG